MHAAPLQPAIRILPHVRRALDAGVPVVALESSVFAQGLPAPANADAARRMAAAIERAGAVPAITAVLCGIPSVGVEAADLERFLGRTGISKVSARDLGSAVAGRVDGATTVAAALALAHGAGLRVLATGGIGGVHRRLPGDADGVLDESADLLELARTPMVVVCAGAKAILDLRATWERLDSLGIPVVGVRTAQLPGFYTATTGIPLNAVVDDAHAAARIAAAHFGLGRNQAVLVVQPPPATVALSQELVERAVVTALSEAAQKGIRGGAVTPYLLEVVARETGGRSLEANVALLEANAELAAAIAASFATDGIA